MVINKFDGFIYRFNALTIAYWSNRITLCLKNKEGLLCNLIYKQRKRQFEADL